MDVKSIWAGEYYAFSRYGAKRSFDFNAVKGKAVKVELAPQRYGDQRKRFNVIFELEDGTQTTIRSRDVIDFWKDYENERNFERARIEREEAERRERYARQEAERQERIRKMQEERERLAKEEQERKEKFVRAFIERTGIPEEAIETIGTYSITLRKHSVELWLTAQEVTSEQLV